MNSKLKKGIISATKTASLGMGAVLVAERLVRANAENKSIKVDNEDRQIFVSNLGEISYTIKGSGDPIVLLHDFYIGASHKEWDDVLDKLSENNRVYAIDFIGFGYSSRPDQCWTAYQYALSVEKFLKYVIEEPSTVIGSNGGADIGLILSNTASEFIKKIICISPKGFKESFPNDKQVKNMKKQLIPIGKSANFIMQTTRKNILQGIENKFHNKDKISDNFLNNACIFAQIGENTAVTVAGINSDFSNCPTINFLEKIKIDLCIIWGEENKENNISYMDIANGLVKDCNCIIFEGVGAFPHIENPNKFIEIVNEFLDS